jgi:ketosteroid isomerase-like protein
MRFEIRETVQNPDPEVVLRALEMCSQEISSDVVRHGDEITLRGMGPSPRSKNKNDTTVFRVRVENGDTVIQGEVNFQASALLGDSSQEDVMRSKLVDLFEQMRAQIQLDTLRVATYAAARKSAAATAVVDRSGAPEIDRLRTLETSEEKTSSVAPDTLIEAMTAAPDLGWGAAALVDEPQGAASPEQIGESEDYSDYKPRRASGFEKVFKSADAEQAVAQERIAQPKLQVEPDLAEEPTWAARTPPYRLLLEDDRMSGWKRFVLWTMALVVLLAMAGGGYYYWSRHRSVFSQIVGVAPAVGVTANPAPKSVPKPEPKPEPRPEPQVDTRKAAQTSSVPPASPPDAAPESTASSADLKLWLQNWAASMRTKDANAQAAFYADTLDRYLNQRNVGRDAVLRDREATNRMRKGLWTVKMENIVVERQSGSEADVRLVKHYMDEQETSEILESFVPTRLTLKRVNGEWKITSEQDLPSLSVTPWKGKG